jgi:uncharacterized membrane protein YeaQ/YmgE (transglycosylase-associated protein family)
VITLADFVSIIWFIVIGGVAGWLASLLVHGEGMGLLADIAVGIVGALLGGLLFGGTGGTTLTTFLVAFVGAAILLVIFKLIRRM